LSVVWQRWSDILWENRLKVVRFWVHLDGRCNGWLGVGERTYKGFINHQGNANAAAVAYYTLFSVFPLTLLLVSLGSFVLNIEQAREAAIAVMGNYLPGALELVESNIERVLQLRGTASVIGLVGFIWAASGVFGSLSRAINRAWDLERPRPAWAERALAAGLVMLVAFLFSFSLLSTTVIEVALRISRALLEQTQVAGTPALEWGSRILPYLSTVLLLTFLYAVLPYTRVALSEALPGALTTSFAWEVAKQGFTVYITSFATYNLIYGSLGAVIAMLLWSYISGVIILLGAEFTVQYARRRRGQAPPILYVEPKR